jgi:hypothetical protein
LAQALGAVPNEKDVGVAINDLCALRVGELAERQFDLFGIAAMIICIFVDKFGRT